MFGGLLKKREAVKFGFNVSITSLDNFEPAKAKKPEDEPTYTVRWAMQITRNRFHGNEAAKEMAKQTLLPLTVPPKRCYGIRHTNLTAPCTRIQRASRTRRR